MTGLNMDYLKKFVKETEYCSKCGSVLDKKIIESRAIFDTSTGKSKEYGKASAVCPKAGFFNFGLHNKYKEDGDMFFD